uniref:Secreted protein n=1 Tax=Ixodes ricinus TaxID=34613 RepID=A0A147BFI4_IXORI
MDARVLVLALILLSSALLADGQFGGGSGFKRRIPGGGRRAYGCGGRICRRGTRCVRVHCFRAPCPNIANCIPYY